MEEIFSALQSVLAHYSSVYLVVDALDECVDYDRNVLLTKLWALQSKADLRLMTTARPDIVDEFKGMPMMEMRANNADVKRFVAGQTGQLPRCVQRDKSLQELVENRFVEAVDGM